MNIYNKISQRTLGIYDVKMLIVRMTMLVGDRNFLLLFSNKFRFKVEIGHLITFQSQKPLILGGCFFPDMIENVKTMQNMKKTNFEKNGGRTFFHVTADAVNMIDMRKAIMHIQQMKLVRWLSKLMRLSLVFHVKGPSLGPTKSTTVLLNQWTTSRLGLLAEF